MGMATLKEIEQRLKSVRNIEKITKVSCGNLSWDGEYMWGRGRKARSEREENSSKYSRLSRL